jgi:hypothetical protein
MHGATAWRGKQTDNKRSFNSTRRLAHGASLLSWTSFFITINIRIANLEQQFLPATACSASIVGVVISSSASSPLLQRLNESRRSPRDGRCSVGCEQNSKPTAIANFDIDYTTAPDQTISKRSSNSQSANQDSHLADVLPTLSLLRFGQSLDRSKWTPR